MGGEERGGEEGGERRRHVNSKTNRSTYRNVLNTRSGTLV